MCPYGTIKFSEGVKGGHAPIIDVPELCQCTLQGLVFLQAAQQSKSHQIAAYSCALKVSQPSDRETSMECIADVEDQTTSTLTCLVLPLRQLVPFHLQPLSV
jgi:hypothetical protein